MSPRLALLAAVLLAASLNVFADSAKESAATQRVTTAIKGYGAKPDEVQTSPVTGLYQVIEGETVGYVSADGRYFVKGDMYDLATRTNLTEAYRRDMRRTTLASLDEKQMIIFAPPHPKHTITVFTDVDCGYCRKLHDDIAKLNDLGIRVRYMAYPRAGPSSDDWFKMEAVWCSKDRREALTRAKHGEAVHANCKTMPPIENQYALGHKLGVTGTPGVFSEDGTIVGGYVPPEQLAAMLDGLEAKSNRVADAR